MTEKDLLRHLKDAFDNYNNDAVYYASKQGEKRGFAEACGLAIRVIKNNCPRETIKEHLLKRLNDVIENYKLENF